jgi:type I restriction enzyme M protein
LAKTKKDKLSAGGANLGFEETLWQAADKLRGHMDAGEYKHVVLGLVFLKYISDAFGEHYAKLEADEYADPEDRDEYTAENIFYVPKEARWSFLQSQAKTPEIGKLIDDGMSAIEKENPSLKGVLPKEYGKPSLDKRLLGELIDLIATIGLGDKDNRSQDILGRVYEFFLGKFASAEGKNGGQFYTPRCVVEVMVSMLKPYKGRVYDPCCGSGGMFVQSEKFVLAHGGRLGDISIYGQESNPTTWKLCKMNLAIRGIEGNLGTHNADSFHNDQHKDLKADFIIANPPFNISDWGGERVREDARWQYGIPPKGNANYGWMQHMVYHLAPNGIASFVLANGSMSSNQSGEGEIRKAIIEADLVDCMVALPGQLFYNTQIPACLWFLTRSKKGLGAGLATDKNTKRSPEAPNPPLRNRQGETLFIDARKMGFLVDRVHRELTEEEIARIANTYHAWRSVGAGLAEDENIHQPTTNQTRPYEDIPGFCKSATKDEIESHGYVLTPGRYVGAEETEDDDEPFEEKMGRLMAKLEVQFQESARLEAKIRENLRGVGYGL